MRWSTAFVLGGLTLALAVAACGGNGSASASNGAGGSGATGPVATGPSTSVGSTGGAATMAGPASTAASSSSTGAGTGGCPGTNGATPYVQPGTQGYRGPQSALTIYSAANGKVPAGTSCSWQSYGLRCDDTDLKLDHAYVQGGLYWTGCGSLVMTDSIFDWYPGTSWYDVYDACPAPSAGSTITASQSTFETSPDVMVYTGGSDIGGIWARGDIPMLVDHSLFQGFPQGLDPGSNSVIQSSEIYTQDAEGTGGTIAHGDGLFSQGGNNIAYKCNYIVTPSDTHTTSAIFYQSSPTSTGNSVIGNYLKGGAYTLYNEDSVGLDVEDNTFGGYTYGDCFLGSGASWGKWLNNVAAGGKGAVTPQGTGCN